MNSTGELAPGAKAYNPTRLTPDQVRVEMAKTPGWTAVGNELQRVITTKGYKAAAELAMKLAPVAGKEFPHFPRISFEMGKVTVSVTTHDCDGLTDYDFELARRVNTLLA